MDDDLPRVRGARTLSPAFAGDPLARACALAFASPPQRRTPGWMRWQRWTLALAIGVLLLAAAELVAAHLGFGKPVLYEATDYGYRVKPNQHLVRVGNRIDYNAFGMRSENIDAEPHADVVRILCIGDSITNGGAPTDQPDTYPAQLGRLLGAIGIRAEVLNVSAAGWAPENELGWLREHGLMGAKFVVLQVATHDLFQDMTPASTLDAHPAFPTRDPPWALAEIFGRYLLPRLWPGARAGDPGTQTLARTPERARAGVDSIERAVGLIVRNHATPIVMQIPQPVGLEPQDQVTQEARAWLRGRMKALDVTVVDFSDRMEEQGAVALYRDAFHPNALGNRVMAVGALEALRKHFPPPSN